MKNKKSLIPITLTLVALMLIACGCTGAETVKPLSTPAATEAAETSEPSAEPSPEISVIGPWGLSAAKNDMAALYTVFGSSLRDYGASMEIKENGEIAYSVGATGGAGTYTRSGNTVTAQISDYNEGTEQTLELQIEDESGEIYLTSVIYETKLWWTQNEAEQTGAAVPSVSGGEADTSAYNGLLELYRTALRDKYNGEQLIAAGMSFMYSIYSEQDGLKAVGYCYKDIDGDGSPELLIAPVSNEDDFYGNIVFDMYSLVDGSPVQVFTAGERYRYYLMNDNTFLFEGANGAAESVYVQYGISGGDISEMMCISFNGAAEAGSQWSATYSGGEPQPMSEDDANSMISYWQSQITKPEYTPFG